MTQHNPQYPPPGYPPQGQPPQGYPPPGYPPPGYPPQGGYPGQPLQYQTPGMTTASGPGIVCPNCRSPYSKKVGFTWWGGVLGPKMLSHVKCTGCGNAYNGKTGQSNTGGIVVYTVIVTLIALAVVVAVSMM